MTHLIIEGDSKVIISLSTKIINVTNCEKFTQSWHLLGPLHTLRALLHPSLTLIPSHVRQEENKVTDKLANEGVSSQAWDILIDVQHHSALQLLVQCRELTLKYFHPPDGVTLSYHETPCTHAPGVVNAHDHHPSSPSTQHV
jgi:hypothetical protein